MHSAYMPTVAHGMRAHLARTETFINNQVTSLRRHRSIVVAHHRRPETDVPLGEGVVASEQVPRPLALAQHLAYRTAKVALPSATRALARYVQEQDARLLHLHYVTDARFLLGLQKRAALPTVVSTYGYDVSSFPRQWHGLGRRYLRPVFDHVDLVLAMSDDMRRDVCALGCPEEKVLVHFLGCDTVRFQGMAREHSPGEAPVVLCVGRLDVQKGQDLVLRALRLLERRGREFRVVIVGDGPLRPTLDQLVADFEWHDRVTFAGHVRHGSDEFLEHLRRADLFAHPSVTVDGLKEGIPGAIVEAMASGLPVVATWHAGIPAVIDHDRHGLLVPERDLEALAEALEALLDDQALRERLGAAAAERARDELDLVARTAALERIYARFTGAPEALPDSREGTRHLDRLGDVALNRIDP
jgi:colanic acid/amylovoran biosynthesis glycosyltransferase